jgi:thioredoxin 1
MRTAAYRGVVIVSLALALAAVMYLKPSGKTPDNGAPMAGEAAAQNAQALPRLVDLGADKCIPCKAMAPILAELKKEHAGRLEVTFIDVWKNPDAATPYNINLIPTQIFFAADGKELFRHEGFFGKEDILAKWRELGVELSGADPKRTP